MAISLGKMGGDDKMGKRALRKKENMEKNKEKDLVFGMERKTLLCLGGLALISGVSCFKALLWVMETAGAGMGRFSGGVAVLDLENESQRNQVFHSGQPNVLYCTGEKTEALPTPPILREIAAELQKQEETETTKVWTTNCFRKMPNGQTVAEAYNFGKNDGFIGIFSNGDKPGMLNYLHEAKQVAKQIKYLAKAPLDEIVYLTDFRRCQNKRSCVVVGTERANIPKVKELMTPVLMQNRATTLALVDTGFWDLKGTSQMFEETKPEAHPDYGHAMCVVREKSDEELDAEKSKMDANKGLKERKRIVWRSTWLQNWDNAEEFVQQCSAAAGGSGASSAEIASSIADWHKMKKKVEVKAKGSDKEPTVISPDAAKAAFRAQQAMADGTKQGAGEFIGRRSDDDDDLDEDDEDAEGEGEGEGDDAEADDEDQEVEEDVEETVEENAGEDDAAEDAGDDKEEI